MEFEGKVAVVTGAWGMRSIGRAIALRLARAGADVAVTDIDHPAERVSPDEARAGWRGIKSVAGEVEALGRRALAVECNLSQEDQIKALVEATVRTLGSVDILVNCARAFMARDGLGVLDMTEPEWDWIMAVNVRGPMTTSKYAAHAMIRAGRGGRIINISTHGSKRVIGRAGAAYAVSKAALNHLTRMMAVELIPHDIRVNGICAGVINTSRVVPREQKEATAQGLTYEEYRRAWLADRAKGVPMGRVGMPEEVAEIAYFLASSMPTYLIGQCLNVDGGIVME